MVWSEEVDMLHKDRGVHNLEQRDKNNLPPDYVEMIKYWDFIIQLPPAVENKLTSELIFSILKSTSLLVWLGLFFIQLCPKAEANSISAKMDLWMMAKKSPRPKIYL